MKPLREHEVEVLKDLRAATWRGGYVQPRDVGGRDSSHHSRTLAKLCRLGLAERREGGGVFKASWRYRAVLTAEERRVHEEQEARWLGDVRALAARRRAERAAGGGR